MEKECAICGAFFETENKNRKYCDDCAAHTSARKDEYERARIRSYWRTYEPPMFNGTCAECGKEFKIPAHLRFVQEDLETNEELDFCSKRCLKDWRRERNVCDQCGKALVTNPYRLSLLPDRKFCSDGCTNAYLKSRKLVIGVKRKCECCGKTYYGGNRYYCGGICYDEARTQHIPHMQPNNILERFLIHHTYCEKCGKKVDVSIHAPMHDGDRFPSVVCRDCRRELKQAEDRKSLQIQKGGDA